MKRKIGIALIGLTCLGYTGRAQTTEFDINGLKVIFRHADKYTVSATMFYKGGTANYTADQQGIESLALTAATSCGTKEMNKDAFRDLADKYNIEVGGTTGYDYGSISLSCAKPYFKEGWRLFSQAIISPVFEEKELAITRQQLISGIRQEEGDPDTKVGHMANENVFAGTRYAYRPAGTAESLAGLNKEAVSKYYYNTLLNKNRMFLVIVGDLDPNTLKQQLTNTFSQLPATPVQLPAPEATVLKGNNLKVENRPLATNYIIGILGAPPASDIKATYANDLAYQILAEKLFEEIRTKRNLSYAPSAAARSRFKPSSIVYVTTTKPREAVEVMVNEVNKLRNNGFNEVDLRDAKAGFTTEYYMGNQSTAAIAAMVGDAEMKGNWKNAETMLTDLDAIPLETVQRVFNRYATGIRWNYLGDEKLADKEMFDKAVSVPLQANPNRPQPAPKMEVYKLEKQ
ncbi:M16 family metallopeptidase [Taibaiella koreensis]|uniref:M16 family metallopeptidase n=1 Tax=Taibaiella koreensis TaxID=1268548 RepID=UPI000E59A87A|nr:pitrilysin family protein [Taibaiella koreensis]